MYEQNAKEGGRVFPQAKTVIERQIGAVDRQIDDAVYWLYNLINEEIRVVEGVN
jgi:hypothetical protein